VPSSKLNKFLCCLLFSIISPLLTLTKFKSPIVLLPPTIPPSANAGKAAAAVIKACNSAIYAAANPVPTNGIPA
jgi:hypothetical protein